MSDCSLSLYDLTCTSTIPRVYGSLSDRLGRGHLVATPRAPPPSHSATCPPRKNYFLTPGEVDLPGPGPRVHEMPTAFFLSRSRRVHIVLLATGDDLVGPACSFRILLDRALLPSSAPTRPPYRHNCAQALSRVL
ncbi:hypothetical protein EXIGLDRAFT_758905 [Exidia glandulosa HHB12029]|uniref:Uncharacterized protein n=1 Tax=Exidia glandulosa HHB12029 TaxID=1314781 RepID=A0A165QG24_EXIGL|nr:hypothetical protein EXIGLDRAFT_758905 [Exidia glandulosa HHB12029]